MDAKQQTEKSHRHLIVGDGITAAAFVESCPLRPGDGLVVIGKKASKLGRGVAYANESEINPWSHAYLLNSPADDIDPVFAKWLENNWTSVQGRMKGRRPDWLGATQTLVECGDIYGLNAPRAFYGDFMQEHIAEQLAVFQRSGVSIKLIDDTAIAIENAGDHVKVTTETGQLFTADAVDIAPGGPSNQRMEGDDGKFSAPSLFGHEAKIADHIKSGAEIFCIGANATMLDALRLCQSLVSEEELRFVACSPSGSLPPPLVPRLPRRLTEPKLQIGHKTAESFLNEVWVAMESAREAGDEMREIRAGFRAFFVKHGLKQFVPDDGEARKVPATLRSWLRGGTRDTIQDFHRLMALGKCRTLGGSVFEIEATANGARVLTRDKAGNVASFETGFVINCSGAGPGSNYDPLTTFMIEQGWVKHCAITHGLEVGDKCQTGMSGVRHLSPATTVIGDEIMPMPLYDAHLLRTWAKRANGLG